MSLKFKAVKKVKKRKKLGDKSERGKDLSSAIISNDNNNLCAREDVNEIDVLFEQIKTGRRCPINAASDAKKSLRNSKQKAGKVLENIEVGAHKGLNGAIISPEAPLERIDKESGLPVYKAHLLRVGKGGGTPLCPFDCDCCF